jgi:hypothetical protein
MSGPPVVVTEGLGRPVTNVASLNGATPMVVVESLGEPVTLVDALGEPVTLLNADGTLWVSQGFDQLIASLLSAGETVAFYDPNDLTSVYAARTGGANAVADGPVGLMLDKAQMGGLTAAAFIAGLTANIYSDASYSVSDAGGSAGAYDPTTNVFSNSATGTINTYPRLRILNILTVGSLYYISITLDDATNISSVRVGGGAGVSLTKTGNTFSGIALTAGTEIQIQSDGTAGSWSAEILSAEVYEIPGYHAVAPSDAARPILRDVTGTYALDFDGVDDAFAWTTPAITDGTWVALTRNGSYAASAAYSAGTYTMPIYQPFDLCAILWTSADLTTVQEAIVLAEGSARGAAADFGAVTSFQNGWRTRGDLKEFPAIDTGSGTSFQAAWLGCSGLTSFPLLDVSSGTIFSGTWLNCNNLTSFPLLDTSNGTSFSTTWQNCSSLTTFPALNFSSATSFNSTWSGCTSLTTFPANMFDSVTATNFTNAFLSTNLSQTSIDNILTSINTAGTSGGTFGQSGGSAPSATGEAAIDALRARGWTVTVTGGY